MEKSTFDGLKLNKLRNAHIGDTLVVNGRRYIVCGNYAKQAYVLLSEAGSARGSAIKMEYSEVLKSVKFH